MTKDQYSTFLTHSLRLFSSTVDYVLSHHTCRLFSISSSPFLSSLQNIMKRLIKRYVLKAQVDRESDEVNEGENSLFIKAHPHCFIVWSGHVCA